MKVPDPGRTALYRFFNAAGDLLYIGITGKIPVRLGQHSDTKPWFAEVASIAVEHHPTRAIALEVEEQAIKAERPKYNIVHNHGRLKLDFTGPGRWTFTIRGTGRDRTTDLALLFELDCSGVVDDAHYLDGEGQLQRYVEYLESNHPEYLEADAVPILWTIAGDGLFENAPFQSGLFGRDGKWCRNDFLSFYTWPRNTKTWEPIDWFRLPARHRFPEFMAALSWAPSPLQPTCPLRSILASRDQIDPPPPKSEEPLVPPTSVPGER